MPTNRYVRPTVSAPPAMPPLLWLISDAAARVTARRFVAMDWDASLPGEQAAEKAGVPIAWLSIARMPVEPG